MTELERELSRALKRQEDLLSQELNKATQAFENRLQKQEELLEQQSEFIRKQSELIRKQEDKLNEYAELSKSVQVQLDEKPLNELSARLNSLETKLEALSEELELFVEASKPLEEELSKSNKNLTILWDRLRSLVTV